MSRLFICDKCKAEFPEPIDQELYKDEHGNTTMVDLCAPCRKDIKTTKDKTEAEVLSQLVKNVKEIKPLERKV